MKELIRVGREMRNAQNKYFKTKSQADLRAAKDWEAKFDSLLAMWDSPAETKPEQGTLFG